MRRGHKVRGMGTSDEAAGLRHTAWGEPELPKTGALIPDTFPRARSQASTQERGDMCGRPEGWTGLEVGALVDGVGSIRKASAVFSGRLEITVLPKISFSNVGANEKKT